MTSDKILIIGLESSKIIHYCRGGVSKFLHPTVFNTFHNSTDCLKTKCLCNIVDSFHGLIGAFSFQSLFLNRNFEIENAVLKS